MRTGTSLTASQQDKTSPYRPGAMFLANSEPLWPIRVSAGYTWMEIRLDGMVMEGGQTEWTHIGDVVGVVGILDCHGLEPGIPKSPMAQLPSI